jgi:hypothetical protein
VLVPLFLFLGTRSSTFIFMTSGIPPAMSCLIHLINCAWKKTVEYVGIASGLCRYCVGAMSGVMSDYTGVMSGPRASQGGVMCLRKGHLDPA